MVVGCLSRFGSFAFRVVCLQRPCRPVGTGVRMESCCVPTEKGAIYVPSGFKDLVDAETGNAHRHMLARDSLHPHQFWSLQWQLAIGEI